MIKFFRRIRQSLLAEGKFTQYLKYAIGEIVLVVIGILIAVNINNWNTERKQQQEIQKLLLAFEQDLITNIKDASNVLEWAAKKDSIVKMVLNDEVTEAMYKDKRFGALTLNYKLVNIVDDNLKKLLGHEEQMPTSFSQLLKSLKNFDGLIDNCRQNHQSVSAYVEEQNVYFTDNKEWFSDYFTTEGKQGAHYFANDPIYKNKVMLYRTLVIYNYAASVSRYRNRAIGLLYSIQHYIDRDANVQPEARLNSIGLKQASKANCTDTLKLEANLPSHFSPVIFNATTDTLEVVFHFNFREENRERNYSLLPNEQLDGILFAPQYFKITKSDKCISQYWGNNDYILLDQSLLQ